MAVRKTSQHPSLVHYEAIPPTVVVLEVHLLDNLAHAQHIGRGANNVHAHPGVAGVQGGESSRGLGRVSAVDGGLDISPGGNDGAEHHQSEGQQGEGRHAAAEPEDLAVCNDDDGQVLEDGVDGDGEELEGLGAGVDHADEEQRDGEPWVADVSRRDPNLGGLWLARTFLRLGRIEGGQVLQDAGLLGEKDGKRANERLATPVSHSSYPPIPLPSSLSLSPSTR